MTPEEHAAAQRALEQAAELVAPHDWAGFMTNIDRSHAATPMMNPTLYMAGMEALELTGSMARHAGKLSVLLPQLRAAQEQGRRELAARIVPDALALILGMPDGR